MARLAVIRAALYLAYVVIGAALTLHFAAAGHGSYLPFAILFSWGSVVWQIALSASPATSWTFVAGPLAYLLLVFVLSSREAWLYGYRILVPPMAHALGVLVSIALLSDDALHRSFILIVGIPVVITASFFAANLLLFRSARTLTDHDS